MTPPPDESHAEQLDRVTFRTDRGRVVPAVTADEMRAVDRIAIDETGPTLFQMMENAGRNLAEVALGMLGGSSVAGTVVVLAGTGGNGGGGIAAGRHLANRGLAVTCIVTDAARLAPVPAAQLDLFRHAGGALTDAHGEGSGTRAGVRSALAEATLIVDALIGYGLRSAPQGVTAELITAADAAPGPVLALDVPSGVDATTGGSLGVAVQADATLTLALPKTGLTGERVGELLLGDVGIPGEVLVRLGIPFAEPIFDERWVVPLQRS